MTQKQKSLLGGVSILGVAGIICKLVGVLYRIPLAHFIGEEGMGLYHKVYPAYNLLLTMASAGIPVAISRMVSHYLTLQDRPNAKKVFMDALKVLTLLGVVATLLMLLFSGQIARMQGTDHARAGYLCIAPSLFLVCVMSAFRGYMQGTRRMTPTAISQLIEQVGKVAFALPLAYIGMRRGGPAWGAAGALLGTTIGEACALVFMMLATGHSGAMRGVSLENAALDAHMTQRLIRIAIPITLGACIVPLASFIDSIMLTKLMENGGMEAGEALALYGAYSGPVLTLINVPTALAMAMSTNLVPDIASGVARKDHAYIRQEVSAGLRIASAVGFPCSIGMSLLAEPILFLCYGRAYPVHHLLVASELLQISSLTIILFTQVQASSGILQGIGKQRIPMYTLILGVVMKILLNYTLVRIPSVNIHGAPLASLLCYTVSMVPNLYFVCRYAGYKMELADVFFKPLLCALAMGAVVYALRRLLLPPATLRLSALIPGILVCVAAGILVYVFLAWKFRIIRKSDLPARLQRRFK